MEDGNEEVRGVFEVDSRGRWTVSLFELVCWWESDCDGVVWFGWLIGRRGKGFVIV